MIKIYCDEFGKEIMDDNYVEQSVFFHYDYGGSGEGIFCRDCWEKDFKETNYKNRKVFKLGEVK